MRVVPWSKNHDIKGVSLRHVERLVQIEALGIRYNDSSRISSKNYAPPWNLMPIAE